MSASCNLSYRILTSAALLIGFILQGPALLGQSPRPGFFSIVNAVGLSTSTSITIDGRPLRKEGLKLGQAIGPLGLLAGAHTINAENADCKPAATTVTLDPAAAPIVIAYAVERMDNGKLVRELKLLTRRNQPRGSTKSFSAIYTGKIPTINLNFNGQPQSLSPFREIKVGGTNPASITVESNKQPIASFAPEEAGNYVIMIYDMPNSKVGGVVLQDVIPGAGR